MNGRKDLKVALLDPVTIEEHALNDDPPFAVSIEQKPVKPFSVSSQSPARYQQHDQIQTSKKPSSNWFFKIFCCNTETEEKIKTENHYHRF